MTAQNKNEKAITLRITKKFKDMIKEAVKVGGYMNESDFIRQALEQKMLFMGIVSEPRHCSCGKLLTREEILNSQGWHCKECWDKAMEERENK